MAWCHKIFSISQRVITERKSMVKKIWVIEVNLNSGDPFEYRITALNQMLKMNAARTLLKIHDLSTKWKESNWVPVGLAHSEEEANQKAERLKSMVISEKEHVSAIGESLYLNF